MRRHRTLSGCLAFVLIVAASTPAQRVQATHGARGKPGAAVARSSLFPVRALDAEGELVALVVADLDDDGRDDLVGITSDPDRLVAWFPRGHGVVRLHELAAVPAGSTDLATGDLDGDLLPDVVVASGDTGEVAVHRSAGAGRFRPAVLVPVGSDPVAVDLGDVDGDGDLDIAAARADGTVVVLANDGSAGFAPGVVFVAGSSAQDVALADVTDDGRADLVVSDLVADEIVLLKDVGAPGAPARYTTPAGRRIRLALHRPDTPGAAILAAGSSTQDSALRIRWNPTFPWLVANTVPMGSFVQEVRSEDLDGDGDLDLVGASFTDGLVYRLFFPGSGYGSPRKVPSLDGAVRVVVADLEGHGRPTALTVDLGFPHARLAAHSTDADGLPRGNELVTAGSGIPSLATADMDGDGEEDIVFGLVLHFSSRVEVWIAESGGWVRTGQMLLEAQDLVVDDVDGDGAQDVLSGGWTLTTVPAVSGVQFVRGNGDGTLGSSVTTPVPTPVRSIVRADLDGVPPLDVVVGNGPPPSISSLLGSAGGAFVPLPHVGLEASARDLAAGDLDGDGLVDLVIATASDVILWKPGRGQGVFLASRPLRVAGTSVDVEVADLDGDGHLDIVTACLGAASTVHWGDGAGGFPERLDLATPGISQAVLVEDLDSDGRPDVVLGGSHVSVYRGLGARRFAPREGAVGPNVQSLAVLDRDGDGDLDLVAAGGGVEVLENLTVDL